MAGGKRLTPRRLPALLAALAAGVLLVHLAGLEVATRLHAGPSALKPLAEPMFTRVLTPEAPPAPPPAPAAAAAAAAAVPAPPPGGLVAGSAVGAAEPGKALASEPPASAPELPSQPPPEPARAASAPVETSRAEAVTAEAAPASPPANAMANTPPGPAPGAVNAVAPAVLDTWPRDSRVTYTVGGQFRGGGVFGTARVQWQRQGALYQARVDLDLGLVLGSLAMTSQGEIGPQGLVPRVYEEQRRNRRRGVRMSDTEVVLNDGRSQPRPPGVQDAASQFVELGHRFASGQQPLALGGLVEVWLARPGGVDAWTYEVVAQDLLRTPRLGEVAAWRLKPRPIAQPRGNITAEFWFAPSLQYLPARIRLTMGDEVEIDLLVDLIEQREASPPGPARRPPP